MTGCGGLIRCAGCGERRSALRVRKGLCRKCYEDGALRAARPDGRCRSGLEDFEGTAPEPVPVGAAPGTPEKRAAMRLRSHQRQGLFHRREPSLPLAAPTADHAHLWRVLCLHDPSILDALQRCVARQRAEPYDPSTAGTVADLPGTLSPEVNAHE